MQKVIKSKSFLVVAGLAVLLVLGSLVFAQPKVRADGGGNISINASFGEVKDLLCDLGVANCPVEEDNLSGASGPTKTNTQYFLSGFEVGSTGSTVASSTVAGSITLDASDMREGITYLELTPTVGAVTLTTVASSTFALGAQQGSSRTILVYNATTTTGADSVITWAAGTGIDLQEDEGETVLQNGLEIARLQFVRKADSDIVMWVEAGQVAD